MPTPSEPNASFAPALAASAVDAASRWLDQDNDEAMLGCECAHPALQIERWGQEGQSAHALNA
ncbi:hypothetical protein [uncultured Ramlibacter sp.]|uniref:hypothetical protein n=1 Tax=uncultured Ramlibacter sp. TaxID=260755 RepID=UPI002628B531|nr:hypothetical protein [uncultured Ramlibacter sp.]